MAFVRIWSCDPTKRKDNYWDNGALSKVLYWLSACRANTLFLLSLIYRTSNGVLYYCVGFGTKCVINTNGHNHVGMYMNGWNYHCNGHVYANGKSEGFKCAVGLQQKLRLEFEQYKISVFIENKKVATYDVTDTFTKNKNIQFYPCLTLNGKDAAVQIIDFSVQWACVIFIFLVLIYISSHKKHSLTATTQHQQIFLTIQSIIVWSWQLIRYWHPRLYQLLYKQHH